MEDLSSVATALLQCEIIVGGWPFQKAFDFFLLLISIKNNKCPSSRGAWFGWEAAVHAFNPSTQEVEAGGLCEFEASQDYTEKP